MKTMKRYTQADFNALVRDEDGYLRLPTGDWCGVYFDGADRLIFANVCKLGNGCKLGNYCRLDDDCKLGNRCKLGNDCKLGDWCKIGTNCTMESGRVQNAAFFFVSNIGSENRTAYAYCNAKTGDIYVRAGCWFSGLDDFIKRVRDVHGGTQHETDYLAFAEFARARFAWYKAEQP